MQHNINRATVVSLALLLSDRVNEFHGFTPFGWKLGMISFSQIAGFLIVSNVSLFKNSRADWATAFNIRLFWQAMSNVPSIS
jgi:hypothetical protein